ncbi:MAG: sarcosine oxidase subunit delta [Alphaproteobacteria bacterium]
MLLIACPTCGPRDETEFRWGGESHIARPGPASEVSDERWKDYLFNRANPKGVHLERWCHSHGCGLWFNVARDTVSHRILAVYRMGDPPPDGIAP